MLHPAFLFFWTRIAAREIEKRRERSKPAPLRTARVRHPEADPPKLGRPPAQVHEPLEFAEVLYSQGFLAHSFQNFVHALIHFRPIRVRSERLALLCR